MRKLSFVFICLLTFILFINSATAFNQRKIEEKFLERIKQTPEKEFSAIILFKEISDQDLIRRHGGKVTHTFTSINCISTKLDGNKILELSKDTNLEKIYEDYVVHFSLDDSVPMIKADLVHSEGITGENIEVAVLDTGIDFSHPALDEGKKIGCWHSLDQGSDVGFGCMDDNGHGTHVSGIISSTDSTYRGVAPGTNLIAIKVLDSEGSGYASDVMAGIEHAVNHGADVISMSLGGGLFSGTCDDDPIAMASNEAVLNGVVVVVSAGNEGSDGLNSPGCASGVITVGAVDKNSYVWGLSSRGSELDIVAPGVSITSTYLNNGWAIGTGTSMACPHVSGITALLVETKPDATVEEIKEAIYETADTAKCQRCYRWGWWSWCSDVQCSSSEQGRGIINAYEAFLYFESIEPTTSTTTTPSTSTSTSTSTTSTTTPTSTSTSTTTTLPVEWNYRTCVDECKNGNDIPYDPCHNYWIVRFYVERLHYCDWE